MADRTSGHRRAANSLNRLLNWYLNESVQAGIDQPWFISELIPNHLREFVSLVRNSDKAPSSPVDLNFGSITNESWYTHDAWFADTIDELANLLDSDDDPGLIGPFILHGSMGRGDYSLGWSDFDIFAVVPASTISDPKRMLELRDRAHQLRGIMERKVPLQHHGVQFAAEDSLKWYDGGLLPVAALRLGKTLRPSNENFSVHTVFEKQSSLQLLRSRVRLLEQTITSGELRHHAYGSVFLQNSFRNAENGMYQLKYLLDVCTLAPAIAMAATGVPTDKGSAIKELKNELSGAEWAIIDAATHVRTSWPKREGLNYTGNQIPSWVRQIVGPDYFEQALNLYAACVEFAGRPGTI